MSNTNTPAMPNFNFKGASFSSEEALLAAQKSSSVGTSGGKVFRPGRHEVTIAEASYQGLSKTDSNWGLVYLTLKGAGEKVIRTSVLIPFSDVNFMGKNGKNTLLPYKKLQNLCAALGKKLTVESLDVTMKEVFGDVSILVGTNIAVDVDYQKAHVKYTKGETEGGAPRITIRLADGKDLSNLTNGDILTFDSAEAAKNHMISAGIAHDDFPSVVAYAASSTPGSSAVGGTSKKAPWTKQ